MAAPQGHQTGSSGEGSDYVDRYGRGDAGADRDAFEQTNGAGFGSTDVFGENAGSDDSGGEVLDAGDAQRHLHLPGSFQRAGVLKNVRQGFVSVHLHELGYASGKFAAVLDGG